MKKLILLLIPLFFLLSCSNNREEKNPIPVSNTIQDTNVSLKPNFVFVLVGKNIDFEKMDIDSVITIILKSDSLLMIKSINPEISLKPQIIKVYKLEDISCPYLRKRFKEFEPGQVVFEYNDKLLVKAKGDVLKVYHSHPTKK